MHNLQHKMRFEMQYILVGNLGRTCSLAVPLHILQVLAHVCSVGIQRCIELEGHVCDVASFHSGECACTFSQLGVIHCWYQLCLTDGVEGAIAIIQDVLEDVEIRSSDKKTRPDILCLQFVT